LGTENLSPSGNNKRIAKSTLMLYFRMILTMAVSLYTSRVILNTLGVVDYGIYNVVGGFVLMLGFLNSAMSSGTQRFLAFEIGKGDSAGFGRVFLMSINIHGLIGLAVLLVAETLGLWFVNNHLVIPAERLNAANWVFQFAVFSFIVTVLSVPYNAAIIAHERMSVFAWFSILEVSLKLAIVFLLDLTDFDKLKVYSVLMFAVALIIRFIYGLYCQKYIEQTKFKFFWNHALFKTLLSYAGWNLWGNVAVVLAIQGTNILLNLFFGPVVNAAKAVSDQVRGAVNGFVVNFQMAVNPQIVKSYAKHDVVYMHALVTQSAKVSFFLMLLLTMPVLFRTEYLLGVWLVEVPENAPIFIQLTLVMLLIDSISGSLMTASQATGKIRIYQSVVGGFLLLNVPLSYLSLKVGYGPNAVLVVGIAIAFFAFFLRLLIICPLINLSIISFLKQIVQRMLPTTVVCILFAFILSELFNGMNLTEFLIFVFFLTLGNLFIIILFGLNKVERNLVKKYVLYFLKRSLKCVLFF
jgi:O-antigen/teichoic acid export membrane protein